VFAVTRPHANYVACHRDLHHGNLIYTGGIFFAIDYTWGAMDDPYTDLANIAIFNCKTPEEEQLLLQFYFGHQPSAVEMARLSLMKLAIKIFYGLEFLGLASIPDQAITSTKSYLDFGHHGSAALSPADLLCLAVSLLGEVIDYSRSEQYTHDLKSLAKTNIKG
jgi:hypothetical protein